MENTSGHGEYSIVPKEIQKWNWGAFWLTWIWGISNKTYISLLVFLPIANIIIPFYLGKKGNELAWQNMNWDNEEHLLQAQRSWSIAGWVFAIIIITMIILGQVQNYNKIKESERITSEIISSIEENQEVINLIGEDYEVINAGGISVDNKANYLAYTLIIKTNKGIFWVHVDFDRNQEIEKIKISKSKAENKNEVIYTIDK